MLITFGDSWVYGVGAGFTYIDNYKKWSNDLYQRFIIKNLETHTKYSFRKHLSRDLGLENLNFSEGGSSNQRQFRYACEYFIRDKNVVPEECIVLWGLTSVYRNELYNSKKNIYENFFCPEEKIHISKFIATSYLNEEVEIEKLYYNIELFNSYFKTLGIKNYWFNIFNDHDFPDNIENVLFKGQSLLSLLLEDPSKNDSYHKSDFKMTDRKIKKAVDLQLVNPVSLHPTKETHIKLSELIYSELPSSVTRNTYT